MSRFLPFTFLIAAASAFGLAWIVVEVDPASAPWFIFTFFVFLLFIFIFCLLGLLLYFLRTRFYKRYSTSWYFKTSGNWFFGFLELFGKKKKKAPGASKPTNICRLF